MDHINPGLVPAAFKLCFEICLYNILGCLNAYDSRTECDNIRIVMLLYIPGRRRLGAYSRAYALDFVRRKRNAHAGSADQNTAVRFPCRYRTPYLSPISG